MKEMPKSLTIDILSSSTLSLVLPCRNTTCNSHREPLNQYTFSCHHSELVERKSDAILTDWVIVASNDKVLILPAAHGAFV